MNTLYNKTLINLLIHYPKKKKKLNLRFNDLKNTVNFIILLQLISDHMPTILCSYITFLFNLHIYHIQKRKILHI